MKPEILIIALIATLAFGGGCFVLGWHISVHRFRAEQNRLRTRYLALRTQIEELTTEVSDDPIQFGIKTGRDYVIGRLAVLIAEINEDTAP